MQLLEAELAPESILPEQLDDRPFGGARTQPEKRLQVAVLADALLTFRRWAGVEQPRAWRLFADVDAWFASDDANGPFTFVTICDSLGFDPAYVRRGLRQSPAWKPRPSESGMYAVTAAGPGIRCFSRDSGEWRSPPAAGSTRRTEGGA